MTQEAGIIDARTDEQWLISVKNFTERKDWSALWKLAQRTPPIWTVRIVKQLAKINWSPLPDEQPEFYAQLLQSAHACNEFDLPGPGLPVSISRQIGTKRLSSARITADGEFIFVIDEKAVGLEVYTGSDANQVSRVRLDMIKGRQYVVLAFAIDSLGEHLAAMTYEPATSAAGVHLFELDGGEVTSEKWIALPVKVLGEQVPRLAFSGDGAILAVMANLDEVMIFNAHDGATLKRLRRGDVGMSDDTLLSEFPIPPASTIADWRRFGRRAITHSLSRGLEVSQNGARVAATRGLHVLVWGENDVPWKLKSSSGLLALSSDGELALTLDFDDLNVQGLRKSLILRIAKCSDPLARLAISEDGEIAGLAMPHGNCIKLWHLPDGRNLGTLYGLAHDALVDFRFSSGGSVMTVNRSGLVQIWEADGNGNAWPWSPELVQITHQAVDQSSVKVLGQAKEMRKRGWLSHQESNLLDLALALMQHRLNMDIEIEWDGDMPGDKYDIEIDW